MLVTRFWQALALFVTVSSAGGALSQDRAPGYRVVVHPTNPATAVDRRFLREAFLKKTVNWSHGGTIRPVDLAVGSPIRRQFSDEVLGRPVAAVRAYWQQLIFSGRDVPPAELADSDSVLRYVGKHPGAIGYIAGDVNLTGVKTLPVN
jgi:ABC-type phosphate transport system substrate-binding protein